MALDVGTLLARLELDTGKFQADLDSAKSSLLDTGKAAEQAAQRASKSTQDTAKAGRDMGKAVEGGAKQATTSIKSTGDAAQALQAKFRETSTAGKQSGTEVAASQKQATTSIKSTGEAAQALRGKFQEAATAGKQSGTEVATAQRAATGAVKSTGDAAVNLRAKFQEATAAGRTVTVSGQPRQELAAATGTANDFSAALSGAKKVAGMLGLAFGAQQATQFFTGAIQDARALGAQTNQLNVLFGDAKGSMDAWGASALDNLKMSQREAQGAAIQFATFGQMAGKSGQGLADFSQEMTLVAAEAASFFGIPAEEMISAMGSAFAGESEPMKKFGVVMTDNELRTAAFNAGITETTRELTAQEKVLATQALLMDKLGHTTGDIERSQGKLGQNLKILKARYEETSAAIGQKFTPIANAMVSLLSGPGLDALSGFGDALGLVADGVMALGSVFGNLPGPIQAALASVVALRLGQKLLGDQMAATGTAVRNGVGSLTGLTGALRQSADYARQAHPQLGAVQRSMIVLGAQGGRIGALGDAFTRASGQGQGFSNTMRGMGGVAVTAGKQLGTGLMGALGGPWGIAIAGATLALGAWMNHVQKSKQAQEESAQATQGWADAFEQSNGVVDSSIETMVRKQAAEKGLIESGKELGLTSTAITDAIVQQGPALDQLVSGLEEAALAHDQASIMATNSYNGQVILNQAQVEAGEKNRQLAEDIRTMAAEYQEGRDKAALLTEATNRHVAAMEEQGRGAEVVTPAMATVREALEALSDTAKSGADKVKGLSDALNKLAGEELTVEEATQGVNDALRGLDFSEVTSGMIGTTGVIDTTTAAGSKLFDQVTGLAGSTRELASAQMEMALRSGASMPQALDEATQAVQAQRTAFIENGVAAGRNRTEMELLADQYGLVPTEVRTQLEMAGAEHTKYLLDQLGEGVKAVTGEHSFTVDALTDDAQTRLREMGFSVDELENGAGFEITALDTQAQATLDSVRGKVDGLEAAGATISVEAATEQVIAGLNDVGFKASTLPPGKVHLVDNTAAVRSALVDLDVNYTEMDGKVVITDNSPAVQDRLTELGVQTEALPPGHIVLTDTSDENKQRLAELGVATTTLPSGEIIITDDVMGLVSKIDRNLNGKKTEGRHTIFTDIIQGIRSVFTGGNADGGLYPSVQAFADGSAGVYGTPMSAADLPSKARPRNGENHQAQIAPAGAWRVWAEEETGGEAYIPLAPSKRGRSTSILATVAQQFGYALTGMGGPPRAAGDMTGAGGLGVQAFLDGGFHHAKGAAGTPYVFGGFSPAGYDCSGYVSAAVNEGVGVDPHAERASTATMRGFLEARGFQNGPGGPGSLSVGWANGAHLAGGGHTALTFPDGTNAESRGGVGVIVGGDAWGATHPYFDQHMHLPMEGSGGQGGGVADTRTTREKNIDAIVAEGQRRGLSDDDIITALMTAEQESGTRVLANAADPASLSMANEGVGADHDSTGIFQQRNNGAWGTLEDRMDPTRSAAMFYDELEKVQGRESMRKTEVAQAVQRSAYPEAYAKHEGKATEMLAASKSRLKSLGSVGSGGDAGGDGQRVYVTNWPGGSFTGGSSGGGGGGGGNGASGAVEGPAIRKGSLADLLLQRTGVTEEQLLGSAPEGSAPEGPGTGVEQHKLDKARGDLEAAQEKARIAELKLNELKNKRDAKGNPVAPSASALASAELTASEARRKVAELERKLAELQEQGAGATVEHFADGGFHGIENHRAHIAPAGSYRVFGEKETGGEAYIPLASSKKARSVDIWLETGRRLGMTGMALANLAASALPIMSGQSLSLSTGYEPDLQALGVDPEAVKDRLAPQAREHATRFGDQMAAAAAELLERAHGDAAAIASAATNATAGANRTREQIVSALL